MNPCIIEMIFILNSKSTIGRTPEAFIKVLEATDEMQVSGDFIIFENTKFNFSILEYGINKDSYFIKLELDNINDETLIIFSKLLRCFKKTAIVSNLGNIQLVWDDISKNYTIKAYPLIHEIENLLRKLITKFMFHNVGLTWIKNSIPEEFKQELEKTKKRKERDAGQKNSSDNNINNEHNIMYQVDFIQLSTFLFDAYRELDINELIKKLTPLSFKDLNEMNFHEIKKIIPKTNWEKYFASSVNASSEGMIKDWKTLYELRCSIAHNRDFTKQNLDDVISLTNKLKPIFINAISKTETLKLNNNDKVELATQFENNFTETNKTQTDVLIDTFLSLYFKLKELYELASQTEFDEDENVYTIIDKVFTDVLFDEKYTKDDVNKFIDIIVDNDALLSLDNFEIDDLVKQCNAIKEIVNAKISGIESSLEEQE